ncbi:DUF2140 family protein [Anaerobacillus alkaliphilus]|uniref:DUF2140 family protein n=1 Tax=Anaerobacillus alkaliphilus TaxID=1548597 RepID=A0A4Q0VRY5_9BACI|nr:YpmS family protein [Anaerobacillus alkaliphilus]RXI99885.1 DUF2140 family protein [Anaerobacillus alkaliphilus]
MGKNKNWWKLAFFCLTSSLLLLIVILLVTFYLLFPASTNYGYDSYQSSGETLFVITTTKEKLNYFLAEQITRDHGRNFQIILDEHVLLEAAVPLLGRTVPFQLYLQPEVQGGNLALRSEKFQIGEFRLPSETLFRLIKNTISFPEWILVDVNEEMIFLRLNDIEALETMYIRIIKFDLESDQIEFELVSKGNN